MLQIHFAVYGLVVGLVTAYQLSCPDKSQRRFLQQNCPSSSSYYTCLFNVISKRNEADCFPRDYLVKEGKKKIRMPGITDANCSKDRYQPTTFYASQFSECMYLKSGCEEEGQVVVSNGTGSQDRSCRCDYRAGYTYVIPPRNQCACVPSEEDCSCRQMYCKQNEALSPDYKCENQGGLFLTVCQRISTTVPPGDEAIDLDQLDPLPLSNTPSHISGSQASLGVLLLLFVVIMVVALLWLRICPEIQSYKVNFEKTNHVIHEDDINHKYTVINGCDLKLTLTYKSLLPIRQIILRKVSSGQMPKGKKETDVTSGQMPKGKKETEVTSGQMPKGKKETVVTSGQMPKGKKETEVTRGQMLKGKKETEVTSGQMLKGKKETEVTSGQMLKDKKETEVTSGQMLKDKKETEVTSGQMLQGKVVRDETKHGYRRWGVKETSYHVCTLQTTNTGTYDIIIINMFGFSSSLMDWWNRCHRRLANLIYNKSDDKTNTSINQTELIIASLPEMYIPNDIRRDESITLELKESDIRRDESITLELKESEYTSVTWLKLDYNGQLSVVNNDSTQPDKRQKYTGGVISNPSLTINQTCMRDGGRYCCFVVPTNGEMTSYGWQLRVIPQEHGYEKMGDHKKDNKYVRISVLSEAIDCLEKNGFVVIKGREGTGKTKLALDLVLMWEEKGYLPVIVTSEDDITMEFDLSKTIYVFDYGNSNEQYWIDKLKQFSQRKQSGVTCKAIFMIRNYELLKEIKVNKDVVDLDNKLGEKDKENILKLYMENSNIATVGTKESNFNQKKIIEDPTVQVKLDHDSVKMIIKTEPILGFPKMAKQFCASRNNLQLGEKYFTNPSADIIKKIKEMVKDARTESALRVAVLVYITLSHDENININNINKDNIYPILIQASSVIFQRLILPSTFNEDTRKDIQKAADSLVGDYLTCSDGVYEFIHPYYSKAVVLSFDDFAPLIVNNGRLELVLEYVRGDGGQKDGTVVQLAECGYPNLCERLIKEFFHYSTLSSEDKNPEHIGKYIYNYWMKDRNVKFYSDLVNELKLHFVRERERGGIILPLHVFSLLRYMTSNWNDLWIYTTDVIQDVIIIYGLLALFQVKTKNTVSSADEKVTDTNVQAHPHAAQNAVIVDKMQSVVDMLLIKLKERLEWIRSSEDKFFWKLGTPLDQNGNTFFHYLILYEDEELACKIFNTCFKYVKEKWTAENGKGMRPIDLAVAFGRPELCKAFIKAYKTIGSCIARLDVLQVFIDDWKKIKKDNLKIVCKSQRGGNTKSTEKSGAKESNNDDRKEEMTINFKENFPCEIIGLIPTVSEVNYKTINNILKKL